EEQNQLGGGSNLTLRIKQDCPDSLGDRIAGGLACHVDAACFGDQGIAQQLDLRGLACTLHSFEGDEEPARGYPIRHVHSLGRIRTRRRGSTPTLSERSLCFSMS